LKLEAGDMTEVLADPVPVTARRAQTQERLMAAAARVFAERGIIGASVEEICEAAGFTRGAFYSNFADKDELVLALIRQSIKDQYAAAEQAIVRTKAAPGRPEPAVVVSETLAAFAEAGHSSREAVLTERELLLYAARQPALREPYLAFVEECNRQLAVLIADALGYAGLEFRVPFTEGMALLSATYEYQRTHALFGVDADQQLMHTLLMAITRPLPRR
jgi:AcrR family transcriptional regulator